jgi:putative membrane protein
VQQRLAYDRTLLAAERTFAAWVRTGLSVAAGGIAVAHLVPEPSRDGGAALALGACFVLLGVGVLAYGARQFVRLSGRLAGESGAALRRPPRVAYGLTLLVGVLLLAVLVFLWSHQGRPPVAVPPHGAAAGIAPRSGRPAGAGRVTADVPRTPGSCPTSVVTP